jgi:hypothetical protein
MKTIITSFCFIMLLIFCSDKELKAAENDFGVKFSGFLKTDYIFDTRQNLAPREGHFYLWPLKEELDINGEDVNAQPNFNILSIQSRLQSKITGPDVIGARTSGYVEMEFFGSTDANINTLRLRHAFIDLDWDNTKVRAGQFWHPLFETACYAGTISFNTGVPFQPFSRNPQIRIVQKLSDFNLTLAAVTQRDFASPGPDGFSSKYMRNAVVPELFGGIQYNSKSFVAGAGASYKTLKPSLFHTNSVNQKVKSDETISTYAANAYAKISSGLFSFKAYGVIGQNMPDLMLPGGYAVKEYNLDTYEVSYTPFNNMSFWTDIAYGEKIEAGIFAAYGEVLGTDENTQDLNNFFGRGTDIKSLYRVSPRISYKVGKFKTAFELEYTAAEYGVNDIDDKNKVINTNTISNIRGLFAVYLFF